MDKVIPIDETMGRSLGNESLEENLCILGVPWILAGAEPEGYNFSYSVSLIKFFCFNLRKKRCSETWRFRVGSLKSTLIISFLVTKIN